MEMKEMEMIYLKCIFWMMLHSYRDMKITIKWTQWIKKILIIWRDFSKRIVRFFFLKLHNYLISTILIISYPQFLTWYIKYLFLRSFFFVYRCFYFIGWIGAEVYLTCFYPSNWKCQKCELLIQNTKYI